MRAANWSAPIRSDGRATCSHYACRPLSGRNRMTKTFYQPFGGLASMMRLPTLPSAEGLDACFVGVPFDIGTSNRSGARFGPRQIRAESVLLRPRVSALSRLRYGLDERAISFRRSILLIDWLER